jgi:hypothetical protein
MIKTKTEYDKLKVQLSTEEGRLAELARRLGTSSSQVSRDERDEYYGATLEKVGRVFDVLGFEGGVHVIPKGDAGVPIPS